MKCPHCNQEMPQQRQWFNSQQLRDWFTTSKTRAQMTERQQGAWDKAIGGIASLNGIPGATEQHYNKLLWLLHPMERSTEIGEFIVRRCFILSAQIDPIDPMDL